MQKLLLSLLLVLLLLIYFWGVAGQAMLVNTDMQATDQSAYVEYARKMHETNYAYVGSRDRMPIYPFVMSLFYQDGMSDKDFFELGKKVNFLISLVVLALSFLLFRLYSNSFEAAVATCVVAFTVFAFKAPYFQVEILFYGVTFVTFVLMLELVRKPRLSAAVLAGSAAGVVHLSKASVIPSVLLSFVCLLYSAVVQLFSREPDRMTATDAADARRWRPRLRRFVYPVVFLVAFLVVVFPYIHTSKEVFGQYFYNVSSTFYMWYDSWDEATAGTKAHGDRVGWPKIPAEEIPGMSKYFREHSAGEALERVTDGLAYTWGRAAESYSYMLFVFFYAISCLAILWTNRRMFFRLLSESRAYRLLLFFVVAYFSGYLLLYAWYVPIGRGNRYILTMMLPATFLFVRFLAFSRARGLAFSLWGRKVHADAVNPMVAVLLVCYLIVLFPQQVVTIYGGS